MTGCGLGGLAKCSKPRTHTGYCENPGAANGCSPFYIPHDHRQHGPWHDLNPVQAPRGPTYPRWPPPAPQGRTPSAMRCNIDQARGKPMRCLRRRGGIRHHPHLYCRLQRHEGAFHAQRRPPEEPPGLSTATATASLSAKALGHPDPGRTLAGMRWSGGRRFYAEMASATDMSGDAYHMTSPPSPDGEGAARCMAGGPPTTPALASRCRNRLHQRPRDLHASSTTCSRPGRSRTFSARSGRQAPS